MTLSLKHLNEVCLLGCQEPKHMCRYLKNDELEESKWYCQKLSSAREKIDKNIKDSLFKGDNCQGYPLLKHVIQGYDVD